MTRVESAVARLCGWDERLCVSLNRLIRIPTLLHLFRIISRLGDGIAWYLLMLGLLEADPGAAWPGVLHMAAAGLACTCLYKLLKRGTLRPRPFQVHQHIDAGTQPLDQFSFPSGHTLHAVAFTLIACSYHPALAWVLVPFTLLVAASRMVLGLHYPSDVLAGAALGALVAAASFSLA